MTNHSGSADAGPTTTGWMETLIRSAWPESAGVTLAAVEALGTHETFSRAQVAYLINLAFRLGAHARAAGDAAELEASRSANFEPQPTREARIAARLARAAEQHEIEWLRRTGRPPQTWTGGTAQEAMDRYLWEADRPEPERDRTPLRVRRERGTYVWAEA